MIATGIIVLYCFLFSFVILFSIGQLALLISYLINKQNTTGQNIIPDQFPQLTIQLPVYNERYVIERLLDSISKLNYPKDLMEIQVLDDSTDDTVSIAKKKIIELNTNGFNIKHIRRTERQGFKAGALQNGLATASGEFIVIFDADFIPEQDFLIKVLAHFKAANIGMVQTRWGFLNSKDSWLTMAQEIGLNGHFIIEQEGRNKSGYFINFNGTAGIWRKSCIHDAGGWEADTLTEDLDLSYRAQMKGWKFIYCPEIITPSELPNNLSAVRSQQYRWVKGGVETSKKLMGKLWACNLSLPIKLFGSLHLLNNYIYIFILMTAVLSVPVMLIKNLYPEFGTFFKWNMVLILIFLINFIYCFTAIRKNNKSIIHSLLEISKKFPIAMIVSLGMSYHNSKAIISGLIGRKSEFIRTPKLNTNSGENEYIRENNPGRLQISEVFLFLYFLCAVITGIYLNDPGFLSYHILILSGFGFILVKTYQEKY